MDVLEQIEKGIYGASYVPAFVIWNFGGKHVSRVFLRPAFEAWKDVVASSAEKDAKNAAFTSVSVEEASEIFLTTLYGVVRKVRGVACNRYA